VLNGAPFFPSAKRSIGGVVGLLLLVGIGVLLVRCANAKDSKVGMGKTPSKQEV